MNENAELLRRLDAWDATAYGDPGPLIRWAAAHLRGCIDEPHGAEEAAEAYRKALVNFEESFLFYRQTSKTDRHAEAMAMSATHGEHIVAEARLKAALGRLRNGM